MYVITKFSKLVSQNLLVIYPQSIAGLIEEKFLLKIK